MLPVQSKENCSQILKRVMFQGFQQKNKYVCTVTRFTMLAYGGGSSFLGPYVSYDVVIPQFSRYDESALFFGAWQHSLSCFLFDFRIRI